MSYRVCIVIPAYNEASSIGETIMEYRAAFSQARIIVIDNNSTDETAIAAKSVLDPDRDLLLFEEAQGKGYAIKKGLSRLCADIYIMTDGDGTYPAADARKLFDKMIAGRADMLVGDRVSDGAYDRQNQRFGHGIGNKMLTRVISGFSGKRYNDVLSGLRIMSEPFVSTLDMRSEGFQLETEMNVIAAYYRADVKEVAVHYRERKDGSESKLSTIRDGIRILVFAMMNWIVFAPLQAFGMFAAVNIVAALFLSYRVLSWFFVLGLPSTTTMVVAATCALMGISAIFSGITLRIMGRVNRRVEIARFLDAKRRWNERLDSARVRSRGDNSSQVAQFA